MMNRSGARKRLEACLEGLRAQMCVRPALGWIRAIREALGMSTFELAGRIGLSSSRVSQLERAEVDGSIRLSTLERVGASLHCEVWYALVPEAPLEAIVFNQALEKAALAVARSAPHMPRLVDEALHSEEPSPLSEMVSEQIEDLAYRLIDRRGLWVIERPVGGR
jgi:predicted DNA-binding mobile mystery protein A